MKKIVVSLIVGGLCVGGSCFAESLRPFEANREFTFGNEQKVAYNQTENALAKRYVAEATESATVKKGVYTAVAAATGAIIGASIVAYCFVPNASSFVKSSANKAWDGVKKYLRSAKKLQLEISKGIRSNGFTLEFTNKALDVAVFALLVAAYLKQPIASDGEGLLSDLGQECQRIGREFQRAGREFQRMVDGSSKFKWSVSFSL